MADHPLPHWRARSFGVILIGALTLLPWVAQSLGESYYVTFFTRVLVLAVAAVGLNIAIGYGGMVSFGHSLYVGVGAYSVAILADAGVANGWVHIAVALAAGAALAFVIGLVCLRTNGVAFIMITLAFAQMLYFLVISLKRYGGDDGMALTSRSTFFGAGVENSTVFYYMTLATLVTILWLVARLSRSRFGWVVRGCKSNEKRMAALGFPVLHYKLTAYVLSALVCVISGFLLVNLSRFASPSYLQWSLSGELIVMVVLGGIGTVFGPVVGALCLSILEEVLANVGLPLPLGISGFVRSHWMLLIGLFIVVMGLGARKGIVGFLTGKEGQT